MALFATFGGVFLYLEYFSRFSFDTTLQMIKEGNLYGKILALAAIPNLFVFFVFIKKKKTTKQKEF